MLTDRTSAAPGSSHHGPAAGTASILVYVLLAEQLLIAAIGVAGGFKVSLAPTFDHMQIIGELMLNGSAFLLLFRHHGLSPRWPRAFAIGVAGLVIASVVKNLHVAWQSALIDLVRLLVPLAWIALVPTEGLAHEFLTIVRNRRLLLVVILAAQLLGLVATRLAGWGGSYLSGDPITDPVVFPAALVGGLSLPSMLVAVLAILIVVGSLKRTAWLSATVVVGLLALASLRYASRGMLIRLAAGTLAMVFVVIVLVQLLGIGSLLVSRAESIGGSLNQSSRDVSVGQRLDEVAMQTARLARSPVSVAILGLSSAEIKLPNGQYTHAIHNTPVFYILGGGLLLVVTFVVAGRRATAVLSRDLTILAMIMVGTLLDSLGQNLALTPSFGLALAILYAWIRSLSRLQPSQIWPALTGPR